MPGATASWTAGPCATVSDRLPATLLLGGTALLVTVIVAVPIGILAAMKQYSWADKVITTFATIGYAIPSFLLGTVFRLSSAPSCSVASFPASA